METRKKLIFVAMILLSCLYCQAQEETVSMLDGNPIWIYYRYCFGGTDPFEKNLYTVFSVNGDTVVNNKRYVKLYVDSYMYKGITVNDYTGDVYFDDGLEALLREEDDRIYAETSFFEKRNRKYYKAFELLDEELVLYDFNVMSQGNDISLWQDDLQTSKRFVGVDMVSLEDGTSRPLYKYYNYDKDMYRFMPANLEVIDHIGCRNMPLGLLNYFLEPELNARPNNTEWLGVKLNIFIQNGKIVYKAPAEDYIELNWIDNLIATKIDNVYAKQSQDNSIHEQGVANIYNVLGQRISVNSASSEISVLPKGVYIVDGNKVLVK